MNLYLVVSEPLRVAVYEDWFVNAGHWEDYCIAELVAANSHAQARYIAWRNDKSSWSEDMNDMPKFQVRLKWKDIPDEEPGIVTHKYDHENTWWLWLLECKGKEEFNAIFDNSIGLDCSSPGPITVAPERGAGASVEV